MRFTSETAGRGVVSTKTLAEINLSSTWMVLIIDLEVDNKNRPGENMPARGDGWKQME